MTELSYLDLDLSIERAGDRYRARVLSSPAGQASVDFVLPFDERDIDLLILQVGRPRRGMRSADSREMLAAKTFGGKLFEAVLAGEVRAVLRGSLEKAQAAQMGLRLRLRITDAPELYDLPWEFLYDSALNRFVAQSVKTPLVRYIELPEAIRPLKVLGPLRVLAVISSPSDSERLDVEREWANLTGALGDAQVRGLVALDRLEDASLGALRRQLRQHEYHVLHFIGHGGFDPGAQDGRLILEDERGRGKSVDGQTLGAVLSDSFSLRLAVLNACEGARTSRADPFAGVAQGLVQQGLPAVIAMQFPVSDDAAITCAREFYSALADGFPVDAALSQARSAIFTDVNELEWATPVLYLRAPDGVLFTPIPGEEPGQREGAAEEVRPARKEETAKRSVRKPITWAVIAGILFIFILGAVFARSRSAGLGTWYFPQMARTAGIPPSQPAAEGTGPTQAGLPRTPVVTQAASSPVARAAIPIVAPSPTPLGGGGGLIAFDGLNSLYVVNTDGTGERQVVNKRGAISPDWSPDGARLAFLADPYDIYTVDPDGSDETNLTRNPQKYYPPVWSPDGLRMAFESWLDDDWDIWVMNSDGSAQINVTATAGDDHDPAWSPEAGRIAFTSERDGTERIYVMGADGTDPRPLTDGTMSVGPPKWSPDGKSIAFSMWARADSSDMSLRNADGIYVVNADGTGLTRIAEGSSAAWSPDGKELAYSISQADGNLDLFVVSADGTNPRRLTASAASEGDPKWSPDGRWIAFLSQTSGQNAIHIIAADGKDERPVTRASDRSMNFSWQPPLSGTKTASPESVATMVAVRATAQAQISAGQMATVQACGHPSTIAPASWRLILCDPFDSNANGWETDAAPTQDDYITMNRQMVGGKYRWDVTANRDATHWLSPSRNRTSASDFYTTVEAQQLANAPSSGYGFFLRRGQDGGYFLDLRDKGAYRFSRVDKEGQWTTLQDWTPTSAYRRGEVNRVSVLAQGPLFEFYINDQKVGQIKDDTLATGELNLGFGFLNAGERAIFEFDNFEVRVP